MRETRQTKSAKSRNDEKTTEGCTSGRSGARLRLRSVSNHVTKTPTTIQTTMANPIKNNVTCPIGLFRFIVALSDMEILSMQIREQVRFQAEKETEASSLILSSTRKIQLKRRHLRNDRCVAFRQILKKIFRRYIQKRISQKINRTPVPRSSDW